MRIFLDIDGVLRDFMRGACIAHGADLDYVLASWRQGVWDDVTRILGGGQEHAFWRPINMYGPRFWRRLEETPWLYRMISLVESIDPQWHLVTMQSHRSAVKGTVAWIQDRWDHHRYYICGVTKRHISGPGRLLIDDKDSNVDEWRDEGGMAVLYPQPWNRNYRIAEDGPEAVLDYVEGAVSERL